MSRSFKHTPKGGITNAASEAKDKRCANQTLRCATRMAILREDEIMPELREVSDIWGHAKDGKRWYRGEDNAKYIRK